MSLLLLILYTFTKHVWSQPFDPGVLIGSNNPSCPRHRKPWHLTTQIEKDLYINGLLTLSSQGKLQVFTQQHADWPARKQAHGTSAFLPWHRYFIWELETQIRNLGGQYECFSLPYWYMLFIYIRSII